MKWAKYIFRLIFFALSIAQLVQLNKRTDNNTESIVEFKLKMIEKIRTDSLDSKQKLGLLQNETTKFVNNSTHVQKGIHSLMGLLALWVITEVIFLVQEKKNKTL